MKFISPYLTAPYDQIGLLPSRRKEDYAYRAYDDESIARLRLIITLRKLRVSLKQIKEIIKDDGAVRAVEIFRQNISGLQEEIGALETIKGILEKLVRDLQQRLGAEIRFSLPDNAAVLEAVDSLALSRISFKEERLMEDLNKANDRLSGLTDVRIVYLPPAAVAASHCVGDEPEFHAGQALDRFVLDSGLCRRKPDLRHYGFNHPNPVDETGFHGYEMWVTIPEDMDVPEPLEKKHFPGGLYAAHMIQMGNFHEWDWFFRWIMNSGQYEFAGDMADGEHMHGLLEEHLNYIHHVQSGRSESEEMQLDLLIPIREKKKDVDG